MQMGFINEDLDLSECTDLTHATEKAWVWMHHHMGDLDEEGRKAMMEFLMDDYIDVNPDKCPQLDGMQTTAIEEGIKLGQRVIEEQAKNRPAEDYEPSQWMTDAMAAADANMAAAADDDNGTATN